MGALRIGFTRWCRDNRRRLRLTQQTVAERAGISRGYLARLEAGSVDPTIGVVERIAAALELEVAWWLREPVILDQPRTHDDEHAQASDYTRRRIVGDGLAVAREVEIVHGRSHGWIDLLAYDPVDRVLIIVEIKTRLDDLGAIERQIGWYERSAMEAARRLGWRPTRVTSWLLVLATDEADAIVRRHRDLLDAVFPARASDGLAWLRREGPLPNGRLLALLDPSSHRRDWLIRTTVDGRRSPAPYADAADARRSR